MKIIILNIFLISFVLFAKAQSGYHITYDHFYVHPNDSMWIKDPVKIKLVFNDYACFYYGTKYGRPNYSTNTIKVKLHPHSYFYTKSKDDWYFQNYKGKRKFWQLAKPRNIDWRIIQDSTKMILGYNCKQAWGLDKGTMVYIWFTKEIPGDYGPIPAVKFPGVALSYIYNSKSESVASKIKVDDYKIILPEIDENEAIKYSTEN